MGIDRDCVSTYRCDHEGCTKMCTIRSGDGFNSDAPFQCWTVHVPGVEHTYPRRSVLCNDHSEGLIAVLERFGFIRTMPR